MQGKRQSEREARARFTRRSVDARVDHVDVDALATLRLVLVTVVGAKRERVAVRDARETLESRKGEIA